MSDPFDDVFDDLFGGSDDRIKYVCYVCKDTIRIDQKRAAEATEPMSCLVSSCKGKLMIATGQANLHKATS